MAGGSIVNTWTATFPRTATFTGTLQAIGPYTIANTAPTEVALSPQNTAGNWLFAIVSWRQDSTNNTGIIQSQSTINVCDDAHNFWVPLSVVPQGTAIMRTSVWMAPAARTANWVFVSPTGFQQSMVVLVIEVTANVPWYTVGATVTNFSNNSTSVTATLPSSTSLFSIGAIAFDNNTLAPTFTSTGWLAWNTLTASTASSHASDVTQATYVATSTGSALTLSASSVSAGDYSEVLIAVNGSANAIASPYTLQLENWPVFITEIACGQILNQNWTFNSSISPWTASNSATLSASSLFFYGNSAGSLLVTPSGANPGAGILSENVTGIIPNNTYALNAWITVPAGWSGGAQIGFNWFTGGGVFISSSFGSTVTVTGSLQQLTFSAIAPATTGQAQMAVQLTGGTPPATALMYVGFAALSIPGALGAVTPDQLNWVDFSHKAIALEPIRLTRSIQYEQQALEAGVASVSLANNDGSLTPGNVLSRYFPYAGVTDVPFRLRAVWPFSNTPYYPLFSGYTDDIKVAWDQESWYGFASITASDVWSRLTAQMLTLAQQENLLDNPVAYYPLNDFAGATSAHNMAPQSRQPALQLLQSRFGTGLGPASSRFGSTTIPLVGDPNATGWGLVSVTSGVGQNQIGFSLALLPSGSVGVPSFSSTVSLTVEFWVNFAPVVTGISWDGIIVCMLNTRGIVWSLTLGAQTGGNNGNLIFNVFDKTSGVKTATVVATGQNYGKTFFVTITFTTGTWSVLLNGVSAGSGSSNFSTVYDGFSFNGINVAWLTLNGLCFNGTLQGIAIFRSGLPQTRSVQHYLGALFGFAGDSDTQRIARISSYGGFAPALAMRSSGAPAPGSFPVSGDLMTPAADTLSQVVSTYLSNVTGSTLAGMFIDGNGSLVYRRRAEWYTQKNGVWSFDELGSPPLNVTPTFGTGISPWTGFNNAVLSQSTIFTLPGVGGASLLFHGDGVTANPQALSDQVPTPAGGSYTMTAMVFSPQGFGTVLPGINWFTSSHTYISTSQGTATNVFANSATLLTVPPSRAPATAAFGQINIQLSGTPASSVQMLVGYAALQVSPAPAPFLPDLRFSDDRAQLFNSTVITQTGAFELTTFKGTDLRFTPTSGVTVIVQNIPSINLRGQIVYTATVLLNNTAQIPSAYNVAAGSIEDFGSWIVQTLGAPVLRVTQAMLTPGATPQAMIAALNAEIGDYVTLVRRQVGAPPVKVTTYISSIDHSISIASGWETAYQLSPSLQTSVIVCDSSTTGILDGISVLGW